MTAGVAPGLCVLGKQGADQSMLDPTNVYNEATHADVFLSGMICNVCDRSTTTLTRTRANSKGTEADTKPSPPADSSCTSCTPSLPSGGNWSLPPT